MEGQIAETLTFIHPILLNKDDLISGKSVFVLPSQILFKINSTLNILERNILLSQDQKETLRAFYQVVSNIKKFELTQRSSETFENFIDLKKFKSLFHLNLSRICMDNILGIDVLQKQLEILMCERCTKYREVIVTENKYNWVKLREISVKYMSLFEVEKRFFINMPWIQDLNLSHNLLTSVVGLETLDHLKRVNISFNRLDKIPIFSQKAQKRIEVLILNYNFINELSGIEDLTNLKTFHASSNQIFGKNTIKCLSPLKQLDSLTDVMLKDNPVASVPFYRVYVAGSLAPQVPPAQFLLDGTRLSGLEQGLVGKKFGSCIHCPCPGSQEVCRPDLPETAPSTSDVGTPSNLPLSSQPPPLLGPQTKKKRSKGRRVVIHDTEVEPVVASWEGSKKSGVGRRSRRKPVAQETPNTTITINHSVEVDLDSDIERKTVLVDATVHAADSQSTGETSVGESGNLPDETNSRSGGENGELGREEGGEVSVVETEETGQSGAAKDGSGLVIVQSLLQDDVYEDNVSDEDVIPWQVQRQDKATGELQNILLVLLENELKERSPVTGRTMSRWSLKSAVGCLKTTDHPLTVHLQFDSPNKDSEDRLYVMEYPDAKVLLSRMSEILKTRRLSAMNHTTYSCLACSLIFVSDTPLEYKSKGSQVRCRNCLGTHVIEIEEPRPPEDTDLTSNYGTSKADVAIFKERTKLNGKCLLRRGSDVEVLSNWSTQSSSSIEVIPETRSTSPSSELSSRKVSLSDEVTPPSLKTPVKSSTETGRISDSTSSGSLTESVVTQYEIANTNHNSKLLTEAPNPDIDVVYETEGVETPGSPTSEIYSYNNFTAVDERIASFVHQHLFETDEEKLVAFVKCHLWRTGGHDFDGCFLLSSSSVYFLRHSQTDFKSEVCDWLHKVDSFPLTDVEEVCSLFWDLGARIIVKAIDYLLLLMDKEYTNNFFNFLKDASSIVGIKKIQVLKQEDCKTVLKEFQLKNKIKYFTICLKIKIIKNNDEVERSLLGGLLVTEGHLTLVDGDLSYLLGSTQPAPGPPASLPIPDILTLKRGRKYLNLYFLDASEASETGWNLEFSTESQVNCVLEAIRGPWEAHCGFRLEVSITSEE